MNARNLALKTLARIDREQAFSNLTINQALKKNKLSNKDKNLFVRLVYGVLQRKYTLDQIISPFIKKGLKSLDPVIKTILELAVYQIFFLDKIPDYAIVNEAVNQAKKIKPKASGLVNAVLKNIIRNQEKINSELNGNNFSFKFSVNDFIIKAYQESYPENYKEILENINLVPYLTLRVKKNKFQEVFNKLDELGAEPQKSNLESISEFTINLNNPGALKDGITELDFFKNGDITVQDQGAIETVTKLKINPEDKVLDLCAAPGGKTTQIAELLSNKGEIIACDLYESRLNLIKDNAIRLGLENIKIVQNDGTILNKDFKNYFDKILLDVPCSGLGVIRRKPEIKNNISKEDIKSLNKIQSELIENAFSYLKEGGLLLYSTCTVGRAENEDIIKNFLDKNSKAKLINQEHSQAILNKGDAFYTALITKE